LKNSKVYLNAEKKVTVKKKQVYVGNIIKIYSTDKEMVEQINGVHLLEIKDDKKQSYVISILEVIRKIHIKFPNADIDTIGELDIVVDFNPKEKPNMVLEYSKMLIVCCILFFGTAFAIMTFHEDAQVATIMENIYFTFTGIKPEGTTWLEIGYSIGIGLGVIFFFNNFSKRKDRYLPPPLEVEIDKYERDISSTVIDNARTNQEEIDIR
jgi:stage V sporulation protein AA